MKSFAVLLYLLVLFPIPSHAEVVVNDDVAVVGEPVMLAARTKGLIMPRGGEIVEFIIDGTPFGRNLSGGDGWAYREFVPDDEKLYRITASSGGETGAANLLALKKGRGIVFIEVSGSLLKDPLSRIPIEGSREAVERIGKRNPVVYLYTGLPGVAVKAWLDEHEYPAAPLLGWQSGMVFDYVTEKGLRVMVVVGSAEVVESALEYKAKLFTFQTSDEAEEVDSWEEVEKLLE